MSVYGGPEFNDTGLALALDAGNSKSYVGSGTTWSNLNRSGYDATLVNSPVFNYSQGAYFSFNGSNTYATIASASNLLTFGTADFSISFWIYLNNTAVNHTILTNYNAYNSGYNTYLIVGFWSASGQVNMLHAAGGYTAGATVSANTWAHICFTRTSTTFNVYLNGTLANTATSASNNFSGTGRTILIGGGLADFGYLNGRLALLTVSNTLFTAAHVAQLYATERERFNTPSVPLAAVSLNLDAANTSSYPGSGTTWSDLSGNGYTATLTNGPTYSSSNSGSILFDGTDDYAALAHSGLVDLGNEYTISAFIKLTNTSQTNAPIFSNMDVTPSTATRGVAFYWYKTSEYGMGGNVLRLQQGAPGWYWNVYASDNNSITDTNWHFVSLTVSNAQTNNPTVVFNIDGINKTSTFWNQSSKANANYGSTTGSIRAGSIYTASSPSYSPAYGALNIANLRVYKRALSNQEIAATFDALRSRFSI